VTVDALPPARSTRRWPAPGGSWGYDCWGSNGRPVLLLHSVLFDRAVWWPAAADLRTECTMIAVDLPGHGTSPSRSRYDPEALVTDLAHLLHSLGTTRAPVVVGHGSSAGLAALFAARFATHALVSVDAVADPGLGPPVTHDQVEQYLAAMSADALPAHYRTLVTARPDPALLAGYAGWPAPADAWTGRTDPCRGLEVYSQRPPAGIHGAGRGRSVVYHLPGRFAQLADVPRFVADLRSVL
jgi:pimeloyl-ACP methyl ester carboxylesterase